MLINKTVLALALIACVCILEGLLCFHLDFTAFTGSGNASLDKVGGYYPHNYQYDNDIDNNRLFPEAFDLANKAYLLAGQANNEWPWPNELGTIVFNLAKNLLLSRNLDQASGNFESLRNFFKANLFIISYPPDRYRLLLPFLASPLLWLMPLYNTYFLVNLLFWIIACWSMWWLARYTFNSGAAGLISGLLCASSYALIIHVAGSKAEMLQLTGFIILVAAAFILEHFSGELSRQHLLQSFSCGLLAGVFLLAGGATIYFLPFAALYGLLNSPLRIAIIKFAALGLGLSLLLLVILIFTHDSSGLSGYPASAMPFFNWFGCFSARVTEHFIYLIPLPLVFGAIMGLKGIRLNQAKLIISLFSCFVVSEALLYVAQKDVCWGWTVGYYYLQVVFPIYLLNTHFLHKLLVNNSASIQGTITKRIAGTVFLSVVLLTSNLPLLGNYYYYHQLIRPTSTKVLYYSFFTFDNLDTYRTRNR